MTLSGKAGKAATGMRNPLMPPRPGSNRTSTTGAPQGPPQ